MLRAACSPPHDNVPPAAFCATPCLQVRPMIIAPSGDAPAAEILTDILLRTGQCDARVLERGRRVAEDTGQRLEVVLLQLGLVSERGLAEAFATLLNLPIADANRYPPDQPLFADRLNARFLRNARALPVALENRDGTDTLILAMADPLD